MHEKHLFEYAVIRVVPKPEREEFLNVGVILYCRNPEFLQARYAINKDKLRALSANIDIEQLQQYLYAFERIAQGDITAGPISKLDTPSRFRWLTATRSTVVQLSKVHPGLCTDSAAMLNRLFEQLVL
jgi:hypothetical protein